MKMPINAIIAAMLENDIPRIHELLNPKDAYTDFEATTPETIKLLKENGYPVNIRKPEDTFFAVFTGTWFVSKSNLPNDEYTNIMMDILKACSTALDHFTYFITLTILTAIFEEAVKDSRTKKDTTMSATIARILAVDSNINTELKGPGFNLLKKYMLENIYTHKEALEAAPEAAPAQPEYNFRNAFFEWIQGVADAHQKEVLFMHLLEPADNQEQINAITAQLQSLGNADKIKELKNELIAFIKADATRRQDMITTRTNETKDKKNQTCTTYLTLILGLGRSSFDHLQTHSLTELDIELGIPQPSALQRLSQWAKSKMPESKEAKADDTLMHKGPQ